MMIRLRALPVVVLGMLLSALFYGWALEDSSGDDDARMAEPAEAREPSGQRLYLLIVDSLALADVADLPALRALADQGFAATVEPCTDKFTTACVREALTGRTRASLFSVLENFKVVAPSLGPNLVDDARALGLSTALVSAGNLRTWTGRVDADIRVDEGDARPEADIGLDAARSFDIVIHHWIWLDVASHHRLAKPGRYAKAQADTDALVGRLAAELPPDMGLVVTGDHGHVKDGRHIEGLDTPTYVVARSPNLRPVHPEGRIPITALRTLIGAITGVYSPSARVPAEAVDWLVQPGVHMAATAADGPPSGSARVLPLVAAALLGGWVLVAVSPVAGSIVLGWSVLLGLTFQPLLVQFGQRGQADDFLFWSWLLPPLVGILAWRRRRNPDSFVVGAALGGAALLVGIWPGLARFAVFRNLGELLIPCIVVVGLVVLARRRDRPALAVVVPLAVGIALIAMALDFHTNHYRIIRYPFSWLKNPAWIHTVAAVALGGVAALLTDRRAVSALVGAGAVGVGLVLPDAAQAVAAAALMVALAARRPRAAGALALVAAGFMLSPSREVGVLSIVVGLGLVFLGLERARRLDETLERALPWVGALSLVVAAYLGLAFTMGLTVAGINFNFALPWFPERWHVRLWWLVAAAMVLKMFLPVVMLGTIGRATFGTAMFARMLDRGARLAVLRFVASIYLLTAWLVAAEPTLASSRLRTLLYDGFAWLLIAVALAAFYLRPGLAPRGAVTTEPGGTTAAPV